MSLPETAEELRAFLDHSALGLCRVDPDGRIQWANRAGLDLLGCAEHEHVGRQLAEYFAEPEAADDILERLAHGGSVAAYETRLSTGSGSIERVLIDGSALFREGRHVHSRLVMHDVGSLMRREQVARHRAEEASHLKDEFLALLSHELRTPLGTLLVWLGLLRQGGFDAAEGKRALEIVERSAHSLERIVEDLLHTSRIAAGGLLLDLQLVDVRSVVQIAVDAAAGDAALKGLALEWAPAEAPLWVKGDPGRLQQAVSNLLSNAVKFTPAGGGVKVCLDISEKQARLRVADSGEGMTAAFLPFAFERFRQQDTTSTRVHHGLGLGLYVVRHVVGDHAGVVTADSPGPGRGCTFTVLLPLAADHDSQASRSSFGESAAPRPGAADGATVLLVDDEGDAREALQLILQQNGMTVATAGSAREGFELVERLRPDILLCDIAMPGEDGLSLMRRVRRLPPGKGGLVPAAAVSAYAGASDRRKALLAGFQYHVAKPVDPVHLLAVITSMLRTKGGTTRAPRASGTD